ncbi:hypothetical protein [Desulfobacca acetoxidans]
MIQIAASKTVKFKPGKPREEAVQKGRCQFVNGFFGPNV